MKKIVNFMFVIILMIPFIVKADSRTTGAFVDENGPVKKEIVAQTTKYYKTVTVYNNSSVMREAGQQEISSMTTEITKAEYDAVEAQTEPVAPLSGANTRSSITTETNYKELTSTISRNGGFYDYTAVLNWKRIPSVRSYDIIGIGHYATVQNTDQEGPSFWVDYCKTATNCYTGSGFYPVVQDFGSAAVFPMPTSSLVSLTQTLEFTVEKTAAFANQTIISQQAASDYAHATSQVNVNTVLNNFDLDIDGLYLSSTIRNSYDTTPAAIAEWEGTW